MGEAVRSLLLADGLFDNEAWVIIVIAIASAIGGLLQKKGKKKDKGRAGGETRPPTRPPTPSRAPMPPRAPRPPVPEARPAPIQPARRVEAVRPPSPAARPTAVEEAERLRERRAAMQAMQAYELQRRRAELAAEQAEEEVLHEAEEVPVAAVAARPQGGREMRSRLERMLRDRSGLQAAIVLSEILGQPKALRDDQ